MTEAERLEMRRRARNHKLTDDDVDRLLDVLAGEHSNSGTPQGKSPQKSASRRAYLAKQRQAEGQID